MRILKTLKKVTIYTDGACKGNPGMGGWGAILMSGSHKKEIYGGEENTTNNRMELLAAIKALSLFCTYVHLEATNNFNFPIK